MREICRDREWLAQKYTVEKLTYGEIGKLCDCSRSNIGYWLKKYGIPARTPTEICCMRWASGKMDGVFQTEEVRSQRSRLRKQDWAEGKYDSEQTRRRMSEATKRRWEDGVYDGVYDSQETREKLHLARVSSWASGAMSSGATVQKRSESARRNWAAGLYDSAASGAHGKQYEYNGMCFRSTWEVRLAEAFDAIGWKWQYEPHKITYMLEDGQHTYKPDFWVPELGVYFDPHWNVTNDVKKFSAVREQNKIVLIVVNKELLRTYEVLADNQTT